MRRFDIYYGVVEEAPDGDWVEADEAEEHAAAEYLRGRREALAELGLEEE